MPKNGTQGKIDFEMPNHSLKHQLKAADLTILKIFLSIATLLNTHACAVIPPTNTQKCNRNTHVFKFMIFRSLMVRSRFKTISKTAI